MSATVWSAARCPRLSTLGERPTPRAASAASTRVATRSSSPARSRRVDLADPAVEHRPVVQQAAGAHHPHRERRPRPPRSRSLPRPSTAEPGRRTAGSPSAPPRGRSRRRAPSSAGSPTAVTAAAERGHRRAGRAAPRHSTGRPSSVADVAQLARDCRVDLVDDLADPPPHVVRERRRAVAAWSTPHPPAARSAPRRTGCARSRTAARAPAESGCAARWCARSCRAAPDAAAAARCVPQRRQAASRPAPDTSRS